MYFCIRIASGPRVKLASCKSALNPGDLCYFILVFVSPFSIAITSLGEEIANLSASNVCSICVCLLLSVSSWCLGRAAACDCGIPCTFHFPCFYSADRYKAVVPVLVLLFVALRFILRGELFSVSPCGILFLCFSVLLV